MPMSRVLKLDFNKLNLNKLIKWQASKSNEYTKKQVLDISLEELGSAITRGIIYIRGFDNGNNSYRLEYCPVLKEVNVYLNSTLEAILRVK